DNQNDLWTQPLACGSFAKRAVVQLMSSFSSGEPCWIIVKWSRPANVQYSSGWPAAQRSSTYASVACEGTTVSERPCTITTGAFIGPFAVFCSSRARSALFEIVANAGPSNVAANASMRSESPRGTDSHKFTI